MVFIPQSKWAGNCTSHMVNREPQLNRNET